jgi:hypothetical protein
MDRIQLRRDTSANWASANPILLEGELGYETDTKLRKIGDGVSAWNDLPYLKAEGITQELGNNENLAISQDLFTKLHNEGYKFAGIANLDTVPQTVTADSKIYYIANIPGTYTNFNNLVVVDGEIAFFYYNRNWNKAILEDVARKSEVDKLNKEFYNLFYISGGISKNTGNIVSAPSAVYSTDYLRISEGNNIKIFGGAYTDTLSPYALYDINKNFIASYDGERKENRIYEIESIHIPNNARYVRFSHNKDVDTTKIEGVNLVGSFLDSLEFGINLFGNKSDKILSVKQITSVCNLSGCFNKGGGLDRYTGEIYKSDSYVHTDYILLNHKCNIYASGSDTVKTTKVWFYDKYKNPIMGISSDIVPTHYDYYEINKSIFPNGAVYFRCGGNMDHFLYVINSDITNLQMKIGNIEQDIQRNNKCLSKIVGKNLLNPDEFLHGYGFSADTGYLEKQGAIMSNKLRLSPGTYTIQGVKPFTSAVVRVCWFNDKDEYVINDKISLDENGVGQLTIEAGESKYYYVDYCRIGLQWDKASRPLDVNIAQFERGNVATNFEACITELVENPRYIRPKKMCFMTGASNAVMNNGWFENACERLGYKHRNVAVSGESVMQHATKAWRGLIYNADGTLTNNVDADGNFLGLYTAEELEEIDVLVTSHTHNYNVAFEGVVYEPIEKKLGYYNTNGIFVLSRSYITNRYIVNANSKLKVSTYCRYSSIPYIIFMDESGAVISTDLIQAGDDGVSVVNYIVTTPNKVCYMYVKTFASVNNIKVIGETSILKKTVQEYEYVGYDENNNILSVPMDITNANHRIVPYGGGGASGTLENNNIYNERYASGYDYLLKKYAYDCYMLKFNPKSKWYGSPFGKPCNVVICSYWHDGYKVFNESAKILAKRHGALYCDIAGQVGFSYMQTDPTNENSIRVSRLYCNNSFGNEEDIPIDGVMYTKMGWHATRDVNSPLTLKRGKILSESLLLACSDN